MKWNIFVGLHLAVVIGMAGCGGGGDGATSKVISAVTVISGNNQIATVGTELANPLEATIKNSEGQPIAGQTVTFKVTSGGGSVFAGAATSDASGVVRERWTLGTTAGTNEVEVRAVDSTGNAVVFAIFTATGSAGPPQSISIATGDNQSAAQLQPLPSPVKVIVSDMYGNPVQGVPVTFTANNSGSAIPGNVTTDSIGMAATTWTLGPSIGSQTLSANVAGLNPMVFNATSTQAPAGAAKTITKISGDSQTVTQHSLLPEPLVVFVADVLGNPVAGTTLTITAGVASNYVNPNTVILPNPLNVQTIYTSGPVVTNNQGYASWLGYFHTSGQQNVDVAVDGIPSITFNTNVTAQNHQYDGKYLCTINAYMTSYTMNIINGLVTYEGFTWHNQSQGTLSELNGNFSGRINNTLANYYILSGQLQIDSLQRATGTGNYSEEVSGVPTGKTGSWSCNRL